MAYLRNETLKVDGINYDSQKEKMKTHWLCMGPKFWLVTMTKKTTVDEDKLEYCEQSEKYLYMQKMLAREALLTTLPKIKYGEVKYLRFAHEIWITLQKIFEGDEHAKKDSLQSQICMFQDAKLKEDKTIRGYFGRIYEIVIGIRSFGGTKTKDEI